MSLGINYDMTNAEFLAMQRAKLAKYGAMTGASVASDSIFSQEQLATNKCTDGEDDGKIGFFSKVGNALEGVWNMGKNLVKTAIKHPFKTAAMIGLCCIPVVGPAIGAGMAAYGLYQGGKQVVTAYKASKNATTDAEAKAAWENIGGGAGTVALSAVGLKGSVGALRGQLAGGSTTVQAIKGMKGAPKGEIVKTAVSEGLKETGVNFGTFVSGTVKVVQAGFNKLGQGLGKVANVVDDIRVNGFKNIGPKAQSTWKSFTEGAGNLASSAYNKVTNFFKGFTKKGRADLHAQQIKNGARIEMNQGKPVNAKVKWNSKTKAYELKSGNTVTTYDKTGLKLSEVTTQGGKTVTVNYRNGVKTGTTTKWDSTGTVKYRSAKGGLEYTTKGKHHIPSRVKTKFGSYTAKGTGVKNPGFTLKGSVTEKVLDASIPKLDAFYDGAMGTNDFLMYMSILDDIE